MAGLARLLAVCVLVSLLPAAALPGTGKLADLGTPGGPDGDAATVHAADSKVGATPAERIRPTPPGAGPLEFVCAKPGDGSTGFHSGSANAIYGCPIRVYDFAPGGNALSPFGNIQLAVQASDPTNAAFFSLHGSGAEGPTNRSRDGNTHTTFSTTDMGISWRDSWTTNCPGNGELGEGSGGTMDRNGNVSVAYTWSDVGGGVAHVYSFGPVEDDDSYIGQYCSGSQWEITSAQRITATHLATVLGEPDATVTVWHEAPAGQADVNASQQGPANTTVGRIRFATSFSGNGTWLAAPGGSRIEGCADASNPVVWDGKVWVACVVGQGYKQRRAIVGDIDVWSFAPGNGTPEFSSFTGLRAPNPRLAVTTDGYFALFATMLEGSQRVVVPYTMGWHGRQWTAERDLGPQLHAMLGSIPVRSAHITAVALIDQGKTVYLVYKEWNDIEGNPLELLSPPDPANPGAPRLADYKKVIVTLDECTAPIAASELNLGTTPEVYQQPGITDNPKLFDDLFDGLQAVRMPEGEEWVFFAVNDYGAAQFGAIRGPSGVSGEVCAVVPALPVPPVPAIPQALSLANPASYAVGAMVGTAATAMVVYLLAVKRKTAQHVVAEDR